MAKLITYDLCKPGRDYSDLIKAIKSYPKWGKVTESCWIVVTTDSCISIRDNLDKYLDANDRIFVATLQGEAAWRNVICDGQWLKDNL